MTRLLLGVDRLGSRADKIASASMGAREAEKALAASRRAEATLRDKLNRENVNAARLRASYTEQLGLVQKWKEYAILYTTSGAAFALAYARI